MTATNSATTFVPADLNPADWAQLQPRYQGLLDRPIASAAALERWLLDLSELSAVVFEYGSRRHIDKSCHTDDPEIEKAFFHFEEQIYPKLKPLFFELQKKYLASPARGTPPLDTARFRVLEREWRGDVELFRPENVPLQTEETRLVSEYDKVCGAMIVRYRGEDYTLPKLALLSEEPDRATRREAWELGEQRRAQDRQKIDEQFDQLLALRKRIAANAGCADYRDYCWKSMHRFDYSPDDCLRFADAIAEHCLPLVDQLNDRRRRELGLATLKPWDLAVDPLNRQRLRPFPADDIGMFVRRTTEVFDRISPDLGRGFRSLEMGKNLDLESRKSKRPGGYQATLEQSRQPFIFMNAVGAQRDVETLLHEGGHAFHYLAARAEPLVFLRHAPIEFCEVASMSMELLGDDHLGVFYPPAADGPDSTDAARAKRSHLEGIVRIMPWIAAIDSFQHWIYTHPGHTAADRAEAFLTIHRRFSSPLVDWYDHTDIRRHYWQRQLHLFHHPFYYVEYGIAQLGALGVWLNHRRAPRQALADLQAAFALGGTRPLPELFQTAGIPFDFSSAALAPLMAAVGEELANLPA